VNKKRVCNRFPTAEKKDHQKQNGRVRFNHKQIDIAMSFDLTPNLQPSPHTPTMTTTTTTSTHNPTNNLPNLQFSTHPRHHHPQPPTDPHFHPNGTFTAPARLLRDRMIVVKSGSGLRSMDGSMKRSGRLSEGGRIRGRGKGGFVNGRVKSKKLNLKGVY
jgi:hypothetical protein